MAWATEEDLLIGDISSQHIDPGHYLEMAEDEINAQVGRYYELPLPTLTGHQLTVMKTIHARLASGRLIMAQAAGREDLHTYGKYLVDEAYTQLMLIGTSIALTATPVTISAESKAPSVVMPSYDATSPFSIYEQYVHNWGDGWVKW